MAGGDTESDDPEVCEALTVNVYVVPLVRPVTVEVPGSSPVTPTSFVLAGSEPDHVDAVLGLVLAETLVKQLAN